MDEISVSARSEEWSRESSNGESNRGKKHQLYEIEANSSHDQIDIRKSETSQKSKVM